VYEKARNIHWATPFRASGYWACRWRKRRPMADVTVTIRPNGPYLVTGPINLIDDKGNPMTIPEGKTTIALCRCGLSSTKPYCDGTHGKEAFDGTLQQII
jgi:CDGSH-type Zn-finger protein